jgi:hypothetical protein
MSNTTPSIRRSEAIKFLGVAERTFAKLEADGVIVPAIRGSGRRPSFYDLATITPAYITHLKAVSPVGGERESRSRRDLSQAELNELRLAERKNELLPRDQVVREGRAAILAVRAKLLAMPRRMAQAGYIPVEKQPAVAAMIRETLEEMSRWKTQHDLLAAGKSGKRPAASRRPRTGSARSRPRPPSP